MTVEERIEKLEQKLSRAQIVNRVLFVAGIGLLLVTWFFASGTSTAQNKMQDVIYAKSLILHDENSKPRIILGSTNGETRLHLFDENGIIRAGLAITNNGVGLILHDENSIPRINLCALNNGSGLTLSDKNGNPLVMLSVAKDVPGLLLIDENNKPIWQAP